MNRRICWVTGLCTGIAVLSMAACGSAAPAATTAPANTPEAAIALTDTAVAAATSTPAATTAVTTTATSGGDTTPEATEEAAQPSNAGGPGPALDLTGDPTAGEQVYTANCQRCHGPEGKGGVANAGSDDGTVPPLNPIDDTIANKDPKVFAKNVDLFLEHGSTPEGSKPQLTMPAWGDQKLLMPQQIADVIAYVISLNQSK